MAQEWRNGPRWLREHDDDDDDEVIVKDQSVVIVQAYMIVLCATWRTARGVYDLLCDMVRQGLNVKPLLMYGASGDRDVEVR